MTNITKKQIKKKIEKIKEIELWIAKNYHWIGILCVQQRHLKWTVRISRVFFFWPVNNLKGKFIIILKKQISARLKLHKKIFNITYIVKLEATKITKREFDSF